MTEEQRQHIWHRETVARVPSESSVRCDECAAEVWTYYVCFHHDFPMTRLCVNCWEKLHANCGVKDAND